MGPRRLKPLDFALDRRAVGDPRGPGARRQAAYEGLETLEALHVQAAKLDQRVGMIVDAKIEEGISLGSADKERHRLLAALVAAGRFTRLHGGHQALGERKLASGVVHLRRVLDD